MNNKIIDRARKILAISMCTVLLGFNILIFTNNTKKSDNNSFTISVCQSEEREDIPSKKLSTRENIKVSTRGNYNRYSARYVVYKVIANENEVLIFNNEEKAEKFKNQVLEKTEKLDIYIKTETQYNNSNISTEDEVKEIKSNLIKKYKKIVTFYPTKSRYISSYYGNRSMGWHLGIDLAGSYKDPIYAYKSGKVIEAKYAGSYGNMVLIEHEDGMRTRYGHMSSILVKKGDYVEGGQKIGLMGSTGNSTGNHLHFEVIKNGKTVNPYGYIF